MKLLVAIALAGALLAPAGQAEAKKKPKIDYSPAPPPMPAPAVANGAIFQVANGYAALTSGARAAMVGDLLTITLVERTAASKSATINTDRTGSISLSPPTTGPYSFFKDTDIGASGGNSTKGNGAATQANQLNGELSVTVQAVYPNGTMLVRGEKMLTLNRGDERVQVSGIVRAADITPDNRVLSTRVADARITYNGKGDVARASKPGWLSQFFSIISPF